MINEYLDEILLDLDYIRNTYIPAIYKRYSIDSSGLYTLKPVNNNVCDEIKDENYFLNLVRFEKNAKKFVDICKNLIFIYIFSKIIMLIIIMLIIKIYIYYLHYILYS